MLVSECKGCESFQKKSQTVFQATPWKGSGTSGFVNHPYGYCKQEQERVRNIKSCGGKKRTHKRRVYIRKCGFCEKRDNQSHLLRTDISPNGWSCHDCLAAQFNFIFGEG